MARGDLKTKIARRRAALNRRVRGFRERPAKVDKPTPSKPLSQLLAAYGPDGPAPEVLHLGGSESEQVSYNDWSKKPLNRMLRERMAPLGVCSITNTAYNPEVYAAILHALGAMPQRPRIVLLHVLNRMTSPLWVHNPNWQFEEDIAALEAFAADPSVGVALAWPYPTWLKPMAEARDPAAWERYLNTPVTYPGRPERTIGECLDAVGSGGGERTRLSYLFNFTHEVADDHPRLLAAREMLAQVDRLGCRCVCYLHPHNHELGRRLLGEAWDRASDRHRRQVLNACAPRYVHDWLELLPADVFYDSVEHWDENGRPIVADKMAAALRAELAEPVLDV